MVAFKYSPLPKRPGVIRLLRLLPSEREEDKICCELFDYDLLRPGRTTPPYEALSYVWGDEENPQIISLDGESFSVTRSLYAALLNLRDTGVLRTIWVDAICINQQDNEEKGIQIQAMASVYTMASKVVVWLGKAESDSDRALEALQGAANSTDVLKSLTVHMAVMDLLDRKWFRRIWILQEVAAARQVLIKCGSFELDGFMFSAGLESLRSLPQNLSRTHDHAQVVRELLRPKYVPTKAGQLRNLSLGLSSLGELIEKYHIQEATKRHDKVYALLGMSSDDLADSGLLPDYEIPWSELFKRLIKYLLHNEVIVRTWDDSETAIIESPGQVIGCVQAVENESDGEMIVDVELTPRIAGLGQIRQCKWRLPALARYAQVGDIICYLKGASKMSVIRRHHTHFFVVLMTAAFSDLDSKRAVEVLALSQGPLELKREFLLVWQWAVVPYQSKLEEPYYSLMEHVKLRDEKMSENKKTFLCRSLAVLKAVPVLWECEETVGVKGLEKALEQHQACFGKEDQITLALIDILLSTYRTKGHAKWHPGDLKSPHPNSLLWELLVRRYCLLGADHPDTLATLDYFSTLDTTRLDAAVLLKRDADTTCITESLLRSLVRDGEIPLMRLLLLRVGYTIPITTSMLREARNRDDAGASVMLWLFYRKLGDVTFTESAISYIVRRFDASNLRLLLQFGPEKVSITSSTLAIAVGNRSFGKEAIQSLFDRDGARLAVTEATIVAALENKAKVMEILPVLLERGGPNIPVPIAAIENIVLSSSLAPKILQLLCTYSWQRNKKIDMTPAVIEGAAKHKECERIMDMLLFGRSDGEVAVTSKTLEIAAAKPSAGLMKRLLQIRGCDLKIDDLVMEVAAQNGEVAKEMIELLLSTSDNIRISEMTLRAAVQNPNCGYEVVRYLIDTRPWQIVIGERIVRTAIEAYVPLRPPPHVIELLLERKGHLNCDDRALSLLTNEELRRKDILEQDRREHERYEKEQNKAVRISRYGLIGGELSYRKAWFRNKISELKHSGSMEKLPAGVLEDQKEFAV